MIGAFVIFQRNKSSNNLARERILPKNWSNFEKLYLRKSEFFPLAPPALAGQPIMLFGKEARNNVTIREPVRLAHSLFFNVKK